MRRVGYRKRTGDQPRELSDSGEQVGALLFGTVKGLIHATCTQKRRASSVGPEGASAGLLRAGHRQGRCTVRAARDSAPTQLRSGRVRHREDPSQSPLLSSGGRACCQRSTSCPDVCTSVFRQPRPALVIFRTGPGKASRAVIEWEYVQGRRHRDGRHAAAPR